MGVSTVFVFPGQGAQAVGMASAIHASSVAVQSLFDQADEVLGMELSQLILSGPPHNLTESQNAQPAMLLVSVALMAALEERTGDNRPVPDFVAGHSLGEFTALVAAGCIDFATGLKLVRRRGELMQAAAETTPSGMAAVMGLTMDSVAAACQGTGAQVANVNSEYQIVIAGPESGLQIAIQACREAGARRALRLEVAGAFHTEVMRPAQDEMDRLFSETAFQTPKIPIIGNTTGRPLTTLTDIQTELADQLCGCVYWQQSIEYLSTQGVRRLIEFGPGKVLTGLAKRIAPDLDTLGVEDLDGLNALT